MLEEERKTFKNTEVNRAYLKSLLYHREFLKEGILNMLHLIYDPKTIGSEAIGYKSDSDNISCPFSVMLSGQL